MARQVQTADHRHVLFPPAERGPATAILTVPNLLSILRILLIPPFLTYYLQNRVDIAVVLFAIAAATDMLDGTLARLLKQRSALGAVLDPFADKLLGLASLVAVVVHQRLPVWLLALSLLRDAVVLAIALVARLEGVTLKASPTRIGKYATFFLNLAVILALIGEISYAPWLAGYVFAIALIAGECLVVAAVQYAWRFRAMRRPAEAA